METTVSEQLDKALRELSRTTKQRDELLEVCEWIIAVHKTGRSISEGDIGRLDRAIANAKA